MYQKLPSDISKWDDKCFQAFIRENATVFQVFTSRYIHNLDVVDDILQEAYIKLWVNRKKIGTVKSPRNYFFTIIRNTIFDYKGYFQPENMERDLENYEKISDNDSFLQNIIETEASRMIAQAIMKLSPQSQRVILMGLEGESMKDIAKELNVTVNTIKTIKYRAIERLSGWLSKDDFLLFMGLLGGISNFFE